MCGIAGVFGRETGRSRASRDAVIRMLAAQEHRGPDDEGLESLDHGILGSRRLAIVDLSPHGHQPMSNGTRAIWTVFNGEIYNFKELRTDLEARGNRFASRTDTEVLVHGYQTWGIDGLLQKLRGMFVFAIYDSRDANAPKFLLARDRLGIKPVYYSSTPAGHLAFASEIRSLLAGGLFTSEPDEVALAGFLALGSIVGPRTYLKEVRSLSPGSYLSVGLDGTVNESMYWDLPNERVDAPVPEGLTPARIVRKRLEEAVTSHLISERPLGVLLSGGLDSSAITALAAQATGGPLVTFTVSSEQGDMSDAMYARSLATQWRTDHREVRLDAGSFEAALPAFLDAMDQPTIDGLNTFLVLRAAKEAGLTVLLSGLGSDELFWGYGHYRTLTRWASSLRFAQGTPGFLQRTALDSLAMFAPPRVARSAKWARYAGGVSAWGAYLGARAYLPPDTILRLLGCRPEVLQEALEPPIPQSRHMCQQVGYIESHRYLPDQLLRDSDVFSMTNSIELRVPFLDHKLVEDVVRLPWQCKVPRSINKPLLAEAMADVLPSGFLTRKKQTFALPIGQWMRQSSGYYREMALAGNMLDGREVSRVWADFDQERVHWLLPWLLVVFGHQFRTPELLA